MRIALVNYRYFISGGPERYLFNIKSELEKLGHEVIPFSVKHNKNVASEYEKYFLEPIGAGDEVYAGEYRFSLKNSLKILGRMTYSFDAKKKFKRFLTEVKPDIVYVLYFQNKISCSIIDAAYKLKIPVVQRISDYSLICPCNIFYRYDINRICELCLHKNKMSALKYKCVYNSTLYSFIKALAIHIQGFVNIKKKIHKFIFPSSFTLSKFVEAGFPKEKLEFLPTMFNHALINEKETVEYQNFALYIGRLDPDKGITTMLDAFIGTSCPLKIIGFTNDAEHYNQLLKYTEGKEHKIEFLGRMEFADIQKYLSKCLFTIIPSEWYDNLPNALLESYAFKKCVVGTDIGSLSENIVHNQTGLLFQYKNADSLKQHIEYLFQNQEKAQLFGQNAYKLVESKFDAEQHLTRLLNIFQNIITNDTQGNK